jgi:hypothetical protein
MGLVNATTNLKSLRFGKDRPGGGSSNQPYIKSTPPDSISDLGTTGGPDFLLRGGTLTPGRIFDDGSRLTKMFTDTKSPNGLLFTAKQNILSRTAVAKDGKDGNALNEGAYLPTSTILGAAGNPIGLHLNKQGLNPLKGIAGDDSPLNFLNEFDPLGNPFYTSLVKRNNDPKTYGRLRRLFDEGKLNKAEGNLYEYSGGPDSILGIGKTKIPLAKEEYRTNFTRKKFDELKKFNVNPYTYGELKFIESSKLTPTVKQNFLELRGITGGSRTTVDYTKYSQRLEGRVNLGNPGNKELKRRFYDYNPQDEKALDKITSYPLYKSDFGGINQSTELNDLVKFRIGIIDNENPSQKTYIHFRAFLDNMSDDYSAQWDSQKFMGRGENFYKYNGFDRKISLGWTVAAQSKGELIPMYHKLNYLASTLAPDYSEIGYMRGNLATLTVGGYLYEQPGIITSINYTVPQESPWEISIDTGGGSDENVKELPHIIRVTGFNFIPIHEFVPRAQQNLYDNYTNKPIRYGEERYIALSNGDDKNDNNYDTYTKQDPINIPARRGIIPFTPQPPSAPSIPETLINN